MLLGAVLLNGITTTGALVLFARLLGREKKPIRVCGGEESI